MKKHQPFGVVKDKHFANYQTHRAFTFLTNEGCNFRGYEDMTFETSFKNLLFADGTPFGVNVLMLVAVSVKAKMSQHN